MTHPLLTLVFSPPGDEPGDARRRRRNAEATPDRAEPVAEIVRRVREGDVSAFETIVREYFTPLARFAYGFVQSYDVAEDIAQGVFCRLWDRHATWSPSSGVRAYLFASARNEALNLRAHAAVVSRASVALRAAFAEPPDALDDATVDDAELKQALGRLRLATDRLSERQRLALHLRYEQELTVPEVAHILAVSARSTERLLARALSTLREAIRA